MSYCRWSSDDFQCDLYVYLGTHGDFYTNVAGNRIVYAEPLPPLITFAQENTESRIARKRYVDEMRERATRVDIDLPFAGESFRDSCAADCADHLELLREIGYIVPQYAIDSLREEAAQEDAA